MTVRMQRAAAAFNPAVHAETDSMILQRYYQDHDYLASTEAILKVISVILCIVSSVLILSGGSCGGAPALVAGGAALALGGGAVLAALYAAAACGLPARAPLACFFTDLILSTVIGILLLVTALLKMTLCEMVRVIDYIHGPIAMANAALVTGSAVLTYVSVTRRWDAARGPRREPRRPPPQEQDA